MNNNKEYNGWTNYETQNFKLWIDNDFNLHSLMNEYIQNKHREGLSFNDAKFRLIGFLEQIADNMAEEQLKNQASFIADIVNASIKEINFEEIALAMLPESKTWIEFENSNLI